MANDIVAKADEVIKSLLKRDKFGNLKKDKFGNPILDLKTNQIRKFLTAVNTVTGKIEIYRAKHDLTNQLPDELASEVKFLKVKIAYQAGRDWDVKSFVQKSEIMTMIDTIGNSVERYEEFARYVEALVAYHKFYGGKD